MLVIVNNHFNPLFGGIIDGWKFPLRKKLFSLKAKFSLPIGKSVCFFLPCRVNLLKRRNRRIPPTSLQIKHCLLQSGESQLLVSKEFDVFTLFSHLFQVGICFDNTLSFCLLEQRFGCIDIPLQ